MSQQSQQKRVRYGNPAAETQGGTATGKLMAVFFLVIVIAIVVAFAKYLQSTSNMKINGQTANVEQISEDTFALTFDVMRKDTTEDAYCIVTALNYDMAEVGRREVVIPKGGAGDERWTVELTTREPAVSGDVYGCSNIIPFYLDVPSRAE